MRVQFFVRFHTSYGQALHLCGDIPALGSNDLRQAVAMQYFNDDYWQADLEADIAPGETFQYRYLLSYPDGYQVLDWENSRQCTVPGDGVDEIQLVDTWNHAGEYENAFYTRPFRQTLLEIPAPKLKHKQAKSATHNFRIKAPLLEKHQAVCLLGKSVVLGEWDTDSPRVMHQNGDWWEIAVNIPREELPLQYKYGIYNTKEKAFIAFESGENRNLFGDADNNKFTQVHDGFIQLANSSWKGAGVAIPVFSLRSKKSFGVGEFPDLKLLADWAVKTGLKMIQILPVNDTMATGTWVDSYPYAAISAFALHPLYINLEKAAGKKHAGLADALKEQREALNALAELDYEAVIKHKLSLLKVLYAAQKEHFLSDEGFRHFFDANRHWLVPYAAFCCLRNENGTSNFNAWKQHSRYEKEAIEAYVSPDAAHYDEVALQYFIQYHLHLQLTEATEYAHDNGIIVKGDIPIGIYRYSCDAWMAPGLYNMDMQAGAPPDDFAIKGQNWGFPTYNWQKMAADGYAWWKQRFDEMGNYFDAFRIDHILGFFRIWSIPLDAVEGVMGRFVPAQPVTISEFHERHIWFDHHRYTRPYITDYVIQEIFGDLSGLAKESFLDKADDNTYSLKPEFSTQRKVADYFCKLESNAHNSRVKHGLFDLVSNLILFEQEGSGGNAFHFRIGMDNTSSFRSLEWNTQQQLKDLYINYFYRRQDAFWMREAMRKLPALKASTNMLVCGEDLGMVPHSVPEVMQQLGILSLEIQRMPKNPKKIFFHPNDAPYLSVVTPSTHDMSTIRGWWEEDRSRTRQFFNQELGQWGEAPFFCDAWISRAIVVQHLNSPAMWSVFQMQDLLGMSETLRRENPHEERINVPAIPQYYWRYRMHIPLEQLIKEKAFNHELKGYVEASGRT